METIIELIIEILIWVLCLIIDHWVIFLLIIVGLGALGSVVDDEPTTTWQSSGQVQPQAYQPPQVYNTEIVPAYQAPIYEPEVEEYYPEEIEEPADPLSGADIHVRETYESLMREKAMVREAAQRLLQDKERFEMEKLKDQALLAASKEQAFLRMSQWLNKNNNLDY